MSSAVLLPALQCQPTTAITCPELPLPHPTRHIATPCYTFARASWMHMSSNAPRPVSLLDPCHPSHVVHHTEMCTALCLVTCALATLDAAWLQSMTPHVQPLRVAAPWQQPAHSSHHSAAHHAAQSGCRLLLHASGAHSATPTWTQTASLLRSSSSRMPHSCAPNPLSRPTLQHSLMCWCCQMCPHGTMQMA